MGTASRQEDGRSRDSERPARQQHLERQAEREEMGTEREQGPYSAWLSVWTLY